MMEASKIKSEKGFIALITVLMVLLVALTVGLTISFLTINEAQMSLQKSQSFQAYYTANACAEMALVKLKKDKNYRGGETSNTGAGICYIFPIEDNWIIKTMSYFSGQIKKIKIVVSQLKPEVVVESWEEVADF